MHPQYNPSLIRDKDTYDPKLPKHYRNGLIFFLFTIILLVITPAHSQTIVVLEDFSGRVAEQTQDPVTASVQPNPLRHKAVIRLQGAQFIRSVKIYSLQGKLVHQIVPIMPKNIHKIDSLNLTQGIYFMNIDTEKGIISKKIICE